MAVIVILAIIALIAVPIILDLIGNTRVSAVKRSAENYIDAVELYLVRSELDTNMVTLETNNKYNVTSSTITEEKTYPSTNDLVEISGGKPTGIDDYVQLNQKGKVTDAKLTINGYEVEIKDGKITNVTGGAEIPLESISLNYTEQIMEKESNFKIIPIFAPSNATNQEVEYVSSDESIVTVDEQGNVIAVNTGNAKITVTSKKNENIKAECNITVIVTATDLTIEPSTAEIVMGQEIQLTGIIEPSNTTTNSLEWKSSNADIASVNANGKVTGISLGEVVITASTVNGIEATSSINVKFPEPAVPELYDGLTPIVYSNNNWKVADATTEWYNYNKQEWANAVILKNGITKNTGDIVNVDSEVQAMFVWIPRYEYKIEGQYGKHSDGTAGTAELPGEIKVLFVQKDKTEARKGYIMHPAFTFGNEQLGGIWVGKFETSTDKASACYSSSNKTNCDNPNQIPYIIPNVNSLRNQNINNQFLNSKKISEGLKDINTDSHIIKSDEWGAVAYLSQSRYGKYGNDIYTGLNKDIYQNKSSLFITGSSNGTPGQAASIDNQCLYNDITDRGNGTGACGAGASTTGNIYGIYDMSGGARETVMGVYSTTAGNSGFTTFPEEKYYNNYTTDNGETACNGGICYGHALTETQGWYANYYGYVSSTSAWLQRGGDFEHTDTSIFGFSVTGGGANSRYASRIVLTKK